MVLGKIQQPFFNIQVRFKLKHIQATAATKWCLYFFFYKLFIRR